MIYISIGSNLGDRLRHVQDALRALKSIGFQVIQQSPVIETQALLPEDAPSLWDHPFLNMVVGGITQQPVEILMKKLLTVEQDFGREPRRLKWSPRVLDLDLLLVDDQIMNLPHLVIPHVELLNRPFLIHLLALIAPELRHPIIGKTFAEIAHQTANLLNCYSQSFVAQPEFVGIVNITPDSFSDGGQFLACEAAIKKIEQLHQEGVSIIELGAQSTKPNVKILHSDEEYQRLEPILEKLILPMQKKQIRVGVDSFSEATILKILKNYLVCWINDVKGDLSERCLSVIADYTCQFVATHSESIPPNQQQLISFAQAPIKTILEWAEKKVMHLMRCGFKLENIIIDPGIGYGKTPYQNIALMRDIAQLKSLGCRILVGHSRKSFIDALNHQNVIERDLETLAVSQKLMEQGVDYLRVHNVLQHQRFMVANKLLDVNNFASR